MSAVLALGLILAAFATTGCQEVEQQTTVLTPQQWKEVKTHILEEEPEPEYRINANFDGKIELVGLSVSDNLEAGKKATFTWYWKALDDLDANWQVFVHFDSKTESYRQGLDHHPVDGLYQTSRWKKGQIIEDVQEVVLNKDYPAGAAVPYIGFYKGDQRLPIKNASEIDTTDDRRVIGPELKVKGTSAAKNKDTRPTHSVPIMQASAVEGLNVDGKLDEAVWNEIAPIKLQPYGAAPDLNTQVKVFATETHLYVGGKMPDEHVWGTTEGRDGKTWEQEVLEIFIDHDRDQKNYLELQFAPNGAIFDANFPVMLGRGEGSNTEQIKRASSWNMEGLESAVHVEGSLNDDSDKDEFWSVEAKIPFDAIPGPKAAPKPGETWATNFYRYDRPDDNRTYAYGWETISGSFHESSKFGTLQFTSDGDNDKKPSSAVEPGAEPTTMPDNGNKPVIKLDDKTRERLREQLEMQRNKKIDLPAADKKGDEAQ
ncbi:MAG: carbohydrate-binding family 9-like protein [Myxococcota bacterium]